ncbi:MAG TPA: hypothetical protein QF772_01645 [Nitrospinaceae bacterium]|jgi:hypothetical protein|nr:hypothetical protein [Nitrospinaceae bacterium]MDP7147452.1 hypothetical protein [Nitrospinaceae bacterium]HJO56909.1 hypothetical protein [Nitrospinaceae bacterium]|tara:strand:- start:901 stop:2169 length:1269 start_codon:yes stop_codon:yes gene_type:complete
MADMNLNEARSYLNYLLTLSIRREEAFGALAFTFIKEHDMEALGLLPEEQFNLLMAIIQAFAPEPKRYTQKLELLKRAKELQSRTSYSNPELTRQLDYDIRKTQAELNIYDEAMRPAGQPLDKQLLIVQSDVPDYILDIAQKRAGTYYQKKYHLTKEAKAGQHFSGGARKFEPDNEDVHREFPGACGPFMNSRANAFHLMLPFDLKITRKPEDPLEAGVRVFYAKEGYSFPLAYDMDKLVSYNDGQVLPLDLDDPNLIFVSASRVKEPEFKYQIGDPSPENPPEFSYPRAIIERMGSLGTFLQMVSNFKVWFDASRVSVLIQGAPDLHEYGLQGGSGLMTRTHASDKIPAYAESSKEPWQEGLSFNFVNMHLQLSPGTDSAFVPFNTPIFSVYPVLNRQCFQIMNAEDATRNWQEQQAKAGK